MNNAPNNSPVVEIVIASHNAGSYLLESVRSALRQTYSNIRVIVVDDGSTDNSIHTITDIEDQRLRIITQPRSGKSVALNNAISASRAEYIAIQDADDVSHPKRIEYLVQAMQQQPQLAAVFSGHELIINGRPVAPRARRKTIEHVQTDIDAMRLPAHDPTMMFRLSMVRDIDFDPALRIGQGYDHILRIGEQFPMLVLGQCLYSYRVHGSSNTQQHINRRIEFVLRVIEKACRRRGISEPDTVAMLSDERRRLQHCGPMNNIAAHLMESVLDSREAGHRIESLCTAGASIALRPTNFNHYKPFVYAAAPRFTINWWQAFRAKSRTRTSNFQDRSIASGSTIEFKPVAQNSRESETIQHLTKVQTHV